MKILHRYVIREFFESFFFGLTVFSIILLLDQIFQLVELFISKGVSLWIVIKLFFLILPNIFSLTVPMAVLFGILLSYGRLSEDNEITAMRSSGLTYFNFTAPIIAGVFFLSVFLVYFNQVLSPDTHRHFRQAYQEILRQRPLLKFEEKEITELGEYRFFVQKVDKKTDSLQGINIYKFSPAENGVPWRISASSAVVSITPEAVVFNLHHGYWQKANPARPDNLVHLTFSSYQFVIPIGNNVLPASQSLREMTGGTLRKEIKSYRAKSMPTHFLENEYWLRFVLALAPLIFAVTGIPLGIITERGGRAIGFGLSLIVFFGYYALLVTGMNIGEKGYVSPKIILWLPNVITLVAGLYLWKRMLRK